LGSIFVFIDESGNFDFSVNGTAHFVMTAVICREPITTASEMQHLKYELLASGTDISHFHASEDKQFVRDRVFPLIARMDSISAHTLWIDKHNAAPSMQNTARIYSLFGGAISKYLLKTLPAERYEQVVLVFDKALSKKNENAFLAYVKPALLQLNRPFKIFFQSVNFDFNGQVADYIAWAQYVNLEKSEQRPILALPLRLRDEFNLFRNAHTRYY
jgi:hypothetical protein